jgi:hypothetical protein
VSGALAGAVTAPHAVPATGRPTADGPPVDLDREAAGEAAERELSRDIYAEHEPGLFQRLADWAWEHLAKLFDGLAFQPPGGWVGMLVIVALVIGLLVALRLRLGALRTAAGPARTGLYGESRLSAAEHRAAADQHAAAGRWEEAVRERMRALVRSLEERALLDPRPGRTADEAATETGAMLPATAERMRAAARTFDEVSYGGAPADAEDHARLDALDQELRRTRPQPPTPAGAAGTTAWHSPGGGAR